MKLNLLTNKSFQDAMIKLVLAELPLATAFKLKGITRRINEELEKYEEVRKLALDKHGEKDEKGVQIVVDKHVKFTEEGFAAYSAEMNPLLDTEVQVGKLKIRELGDKVNTLSANDVTLLEGLFEE